MPTDPAPWRHELFAVLREFDAGGARQIWVEHGRIPNGKVCATLRARGVLDGMPRRRSCVCDGNSMTSLRNLRGAAGTAGAGALTGACWLGAEPCGAARVRSTLHTSG